MEESQMKDYFIRAQEPQYYDRMMLVTEKSFADIIKLGERIEEGIKNGTIINLEALQATNKALQSVNLEDPDRELFDPPTGQHYPYRQARFLYSNNTGEYGLHIAPDASTDVVEMLIIVRA
ncbi:hypothetical protein H5410_064206 [Solanum commersonii]|uniref:Uncharacterized protein n=1 Tax=Solanum commersonii TaxID=4109 RepID=A0A9J5VZY0_SOLCO|nr:hypothetical protein H5410_064206 [Solanum commersonii]